MAGRILSLSLSLIGVLLLSLSGDVLSQDELFVPTVAQLQQGVTAGMASLQLEAQYHLSHAQVMTHGALFVLSQEHSAAYLPQVWTAQEAQG